MLALMEQVEKEEFLSEISRVFEVQAHHIVGVLTEYYDDKVKLVVEQFDGLHRVIDDVRQALASHEGKIDLIVADVVVIKNELKVKADARDVATLDHRVHVLEAKR